MTIDRLFNDSADRAGTAARCPALERRPWLIAIGCGVVVYIVISYIVVPLSLAAFNGTTDRTVMAVSLAVPNLAFALPITLVCRRPMEARR